MDILYPSIIVVLTGFFVLLYFMHLLPRISLQEDVSQEVEMLEEEQLSEAERI